jgi:hypothetical protein
MHVLDQHVGGDQNALLRAADPQQRRVVPDAHDQIVLPAPPGHQSGDALDQGELAAEFRAAGAGRTEPLSPFS